MSLERQTSEIYKSYGFSAECAYRDAEALNVDAPPFTQEQWGAALFAYYYYLAMVTAKDGTYSNKSAKRRLEVLEAKFGAMIASVDAIWTVVYNMKIVGNRVVTIWNNTLKAQRGSPEMQKLVANFKLF